MRYLCWRWLSFASCGRTSTSYILWIPVLPGNSFTYCIFLHVPSQGFLTSFIESAQWRKPPLPPLSQSLASVGVDVGGQLHIGDDTDLTGDFSCYRQVCEHDMTWLSFPKVNYKRINKVLSNLIYPKLPNQHNDIHRPFFFVAIKTGILGPLIY